MKASKLKTNTSWETAYQGHKRALSLISNNTGYGNKLQNKHDFSAIQITLFYIFVTAILLGYVYYLNQDTIRSYLERNQTAKMGEQAR